MRVVQILPVLSFGDAVGNDAINLKAALQRAGYDTELYAAIIDERLPDGTAKQFDMLEELKEDDIVLYHLSTGHELNYKIEKLGGRKIIRYHNVTPAEYFRRYNRNVYYGCMQGIQAAKHLAKVADYALAVSEYNKSDLLEYGYRCGIDVLPILIPFEDYEKKPNQKIIKKYSDGYTNILFTGRIVPNKKQEDIIDAFYYYKKYINSKSRLILVGTYAGIDKYHEQLEKYVRELGLKDVIFTGQVKFDVILAYYHLADVFLCMSEHEGFCVPLVEAMYFGIPIIARDTSAIAGTLGGSGLLLQDNDPIVAAEMINQVVENKTLRKQVVENQKVRLKDFQNEKVEKEFVRLIHEFIERS